MTSYKKKQLQPRRRSHAVIIEYREPRKKKQLDLFDYIRPSSSAPAEKCFDCGQPLRPEEIKTGICSACFGPRR